MRRFLLQFVILLLSCTLLAQPQRGIKGEYNMSNYPEVSFIWNSPNPVALEKSAFTLNDESNNPIEFQLAVLPPKDTIYKKSVLFLWEDMKSHSNQSENTRKLLVDFFKKTAFDKSTKFNVAVFNRKSDHEKSVLKALMPNFSDNKSELVSKIEGYEKSTRVFKENPKETDLYSAIEEGIGMLKKEPSERVGVIVVVTAGLNMKASGASTEMATVLDDARRAGIPIYVVKYHQIAGDSPEVNSLAEKTFGQKINLTDGIVDETVAELQKIYKNLDKNCYGQDYKFTFTTDVPRDGKPHRLNLSVDKTPRLIPPFTAPRMTFGLWVNEHLLLFILLILLLVGLIVLAIWLIMRFAKKYKKREAENKAQLQQEIDKANQERANLADIVNMQRQKEEAKQREDAQKAREAEENRLLQLMHVKNLYPRLQCDVADSSYTYTIHQLVTRIGRNENNDVVLPHHTVSGFHAEIRFNGTSFEVFNRSQSYRQGIIVNGQFFQQCTLRNGDMIGLGEAVIMFYV